MSARRGSLSVRLRLLLGTGLIAILAAIAALLSAYGAAQSARLIDIAAHAETRIELIGALSGRVGDYAIVAVQQAGAPGLGPQERAARLTARAEAVRAAFARVDAALARAVEDARGLDPDEQSARATRSLGLARMRALFDALDAAIAGEPADPDPLRAELDGFATRFSPLLNQAIEDERRARAAAFAAVERLRERLIWAAAAVIAIAAGAVTVFHLAITRPLGARLGMAAGAAAAIGRGSFATRLRARGRDEIGLLF
ncbi:MAG: hypothetical protein RQ752_15755, partial [Thermohalobaculum sp.]|nr:hypothetical protein [Thermohalobaculum sp.]